MYTFLVTITILFAGILAISGVCATLDATSTKKDRLQGIGVVLGVLALSFVFCKTTTIDLSDTSDVKHSTEAWHTVYKNNINADVTVSTDNITLNPKKSVTRADKEKLFTKGTIIPFSLSSNTVTITATNKNDSTSKEAKLTEENFIEKWPKGTNPDKSNGRITKIEYRSTPISLKWFGMTVEKKSYDEARITVEYEGTNEPSTKQLFGKN